LETTPADIVKVIRKAEEDKGRKRMGRSKSGGNLPGKSWGMHVDEVRPACWKEMEVEVHMSSGHEIIEVLRDQRELELEAAPAKRNLPNLVHTTRGGRKRLQTLLEGSEKTKRQ
jgi:hypothetical protein